MTKLLESLKIKKPSAILALALLGVALIAAAFIAVTRWNRQITAQRQQLEAAASIEVQESQLRAPSTEGITAYLNSSDVRATAVLNGVRYFATSGGLVAVDEGGTVKRRYSTLDGLTDNDLTALAVFRNRLFIGTATAGMMAFDGNNFTGYRFVKPKATRVSVLLPMETELLVGTLDGGLFEYDGERFTRRLNSATGADFGKVTALLAHDSRLYIGTQDKGLYLWREAQFQRFATPEGLPATRVTGLAAMPSTDEIAVATDFGVVLLNDEGKIRELSKQSNITSIAVSRGRLYAGLFSGSIIELGADIKDTAKGTSNSGQTEIAGLSQTTPTITFADEGNLWALTTQGAFARDESGNRAAFESVYSPSPNDTILTAAHITSLAFDNDGRLWVGYFDRGVDVISTETVERLTHIEDDRVREVNFIAFDNDNDRALVATSRGLVTLDSRLKQSALTREQGGLIDNAIAHVSFADDAAGRGRRLVLATAGGLTDYSQGRARSITAFHGLSSNHLYASESVGSRLYVGSLAGLAELEGLRVVRVFKKSNSKLSEDWVTALAEAEGTLYIGTIGGVDALLPTGEMVNFADDIGKVEVNLNAMHFDGERVYVGTSDKGIFAYNVRERRWSRLSAGLTSPNVTAIASDDRFIYVGTLNGLVRIEKRIFS